MPTKKSIASKSKIVKPVGQKAAVKKAPPDKGEKAATEKGEGLSVLRQVLHLSPSRKRAAPDKVEHLVRDYLTKLREVDLTFQNGTTVVEKYRSKYPELSNHLRIVPEERLIEITQNRGDDADPSLHLFLIRVLDDGPLYEVTRSGEKEQKTLKSSEWLALLHDSLARLIARILYARETSNS
jgi:hypothetical protein